MRYLLFALCAWLAAAQSLPDRVEAIIQSTPESRRAHWGLEVVDLNGGGTLLSRQSESLFTPASNVKLFTTALALLRLGADYRFATSVRAAALPQPSGTLPGDLVLMGGGDPALSGRVYPYEKGREPGDDWQAIEALADQLVARGVKRIEGDVIGDDTRYVWAPRGVGWTAGDLAWGYGAPVSALSFADNVQTLILEPGAREGSTARVSLRPDVEYFHFDNRIRTIAAGETTLRLWREPGSRRVLLRGSILLRGQNAREALSVDDPAEFAALVLYDALQRRGVFVRGKPRARHRYLDDPGGEQAHQEGVELARRESPPLLELLRLVNKVSQNLHAELLLREVGYQRRGKGTAEAGLEELATLLKEAGVEDRLWGLEDGSGLGRGNQLSPAAITGLLRYLYQGPWRDDWISLLPVGGRDGTLASRFSGAPQAERIRAKTGTLSRASALSGYALRADGKAWAFAILANGYLPAEGPVIRQTIDKIALALLD